ncbi:hypothetical protein X741_30065 [Mesorhizobium sp. LNHC229A00]|nr:hypothetical protein X741_30065 [Mesorhizobium sp. LNHC229A00]
MRVIGVRRSWPAAATSRMRLSVAVFSLDESWFSACAVALTSAERLGDGLDFTMASPLRGTRLARACS